MLNPAEDIVSVWLQEVCGHFIMNNVVLRKETRLIGGMKIGGGRGKEIDFLSTDGRNHYWIEVSVSPNPRLPVKSVRGKKIIDDTLKKFIAEKEKSLRKRYKKYITFEKWFIYSPKFFLKKSDEENAFCHALERQHIKAISFDIVLEEVFKKLDYWGYDAPRQYLYLLKKFGYKREN